MSLKLWGGILVGVFIAAVGTEIIKRKYPGFANKVSKQAKDITGSTCEKIKDFTSSAKDAFRSGYVSVKT